MAGIFPGGGDDSFLQGDETVDELEGRAGRIARHDAPVEERPARIGEQFHVVVAPVAADQFVGVVARTADHDEDFSRCWLYGDDAAHLARHQLFAECLQTGVERCGDGRTGYRLQVGRAVHVGALFDAVHIHDAHLHPLFAAQHLFVGAFYARHSAVVAGLVVVVAGYRRRIRLADITEQVARHLARIGAHGPVDGIETGELSFVEEQLGFEAHLFDDDRGAATRVPGGLVELGFQLFGRNARDAGQGERVELAHVARNGHEVVGGYAAHEQFAVAVVHLAARRVLHLSPQHVVLGGPFVRIVEYLYLEKTQEQDGEGHDNE